MLCPAMKERRMDRIWSVENFDKTSVTQHYPMLERFHNYIFFRFMTRLTGGSRRRTQRPWPLLARGGGGLVKRR